MPKKRRDKQNNSKTGGNDGEKSKKPRMKVAKHYDSLPLPRPLEELLSYFDLVDKVICFTMKCRLDPTISTLGKLVPGDAFSLPLVLSLCRVTQYNGGRFYLAVNYLPKPDGTENLELVYSILRGTSVSQVAQRRRAVRIALVDYTKALHEAWLEQEQEEEVWEQGGAWNYDTSGWHKDFDVTYTPLPDPLPMPPPPHGIGEQTSSSMFLVQQNKQGEQRTALGASMNFDQSSLDTGPAFSLMRAGKDAESSSTSTTTASSSSCSGKPKAEQYLDHLRTLPFYRDQIAASTTLPGRPASFVEGAPNGIHPLVWACIGTNLGFTRLYRHQHEAMDTIFAGHHVAISTSTASGKSLIYNATVLTAMCKYMDARASGMASGSARPTALYMFPTKALARDQLRALHVMTGQAGPPCPTTSIGVHVHVVDGDTGYAARRTARTHTDIMLTNPDMLHCSLLPDYAEWSDFLRGLRFVVLDEAHTYSGAFGAHVGMVLRRLVRVCLYLGTRPQFICCSATIANPKVHARKLVPLDAFGVDVDIHVIDEDTSPLAPRTLTIWNPPLKQTADIGIDVTKGTSAVYGCQMSNVANHVNKGVGDDNQQDHNEERRNSDIKSEYKIIERAENALPEEDIVDYVVDAYRPGTREDKAASKPYADLDLALQEFLRGCEDRPNTILLDEDRVRMAGRLRRQDRIKLLLERRMVVKARKTGDGATQTRPVQRSKLDVLAAKWALQGTGAAWEGLQSNHDVESTESTDIRTVGGKTQAPVVVVPGLIDHARERVSSIVQTALVFVALVKKRLRTIAFCKFRKVTEMVLRYALQDLHSSAPHLTHTVASYRGGYEKTERREIEHGLFSGSITGVTATCALELGMDIGDLDVTLHLGFPGTFSSYWQQLGRAGRTGESSLSILICFETPLDQHFVKKPEVLFASSPESISISTDNVYILRAHIPCAARECPIVLRRSALAGYPTSLLDKLLQTATNKVDDTPSEISDPGTEEGQEQRQGEGQGKGQEEREVNNWSGGFFPKGHSSRPVNYDMGMDDDRRVFGAGLVDAVMYLVGCGRLEVDKLRMETSLESDLCYFRYPLTLPPPQRMVSLRLIDPVSFAVIDMADGDPEVGTRIDTVPYSRAFFELFEGAIYMHRAQQYVIIRLDVQTLRALCKPVSVNYYTRAMNTFNVNIIRRFVSACYAHSLAATAIVPTDDADLLNDEEKCGHYMSEPVCMGSVQVLSTVNGYCKYALSTGAMLERGSCSLPPLEYDTTAFWVDFAPEVRTALRLGGHAFAAAAHATSHALVVVAQLVASCDANDVGCPHLSGHASGVDASRVLVFDSRPGGIGIAETLFESRASVLARAADLLKNCPCRNGCLACIMDHACPMRNHNIDKKGAVIVLENTLKALVCAPSEPNTQAKAGGFGTVGTFRTNSSITAVRHTDDPSSEDDTPRRARRRAALRRAQDLVGAREMGMQVQRPWTASQSLFQTD